MNANMYQYPIKTHPEGINTLAEVESQLLDTSSSASQSLEQLRSGLARRNNRPADERLWEICGLERGATIRDAITVVMARGHVLNFGVIDIFSADTKIEEVFEALRIKPRGELELAGASIDIVNVYTNAADAQAILTQLREVMDDFVLIDSSDSWAIVFFHSGAVCLLDRQNASAAKEQI